jgi:2-polyprenyl-3-methyl-5-hydroxy-6-metoxy-1,4-benzoquinol methylase
VASTQISAHFDDCPEAGAHSIAAIEDRHFWFAARAALIQRELGGGLGGIAGKSVVDIGCGTGYVLGVLERAGMVTTGCDMHESALEYARQRITGKLLCMDANDLKGSDFDAAMLCDVIEHADDDVALVQVARNAVRPGGIVLVTVPALQWLWTPIDDISGHKRRYTHAMLSKVFRDAGLTHVRVSYFNRLLLPVQALRKLQVRGHHDTDSIRSAATVVPPGPINSAMALAMKADSYLPGRITGCSLIATGRVA